MDFNRNTFRLKRDKVRFSETFLRSTEPNNTEESWGQPIQVIAKCLSFYYYNLFPQEMFCVYDFLWRLQSLPICILEIPFPMEILNYPSRHLLESGVCFRACDSSERSEAIVHYFDWRLYKMVVSPSRLKWLNILKPRLFYSRYHLIIF